MQALKLSIFLPVLALSLLSAPTIAHNGIAADDHAAWVHYYENQAREEAEKLSENKKLLDQYDNHSEFYGRQGQDFHSHIIANIREHEKALQDNLKQAELHRIMKKEQDDPITKAKIDLDRDSATVR